MLGGCRGKAFILNRTLIDNEEQRLEGHPGTCHGSVPVTLREQGGGQWPGTEGTTRRRNENRAVRKMEQ